MRLQKFCLGDIYIYFAFQKKKFKKELTFTLHFPPSIRAAASRCRAKKKVWVEDMERRGKEMDTLNQALQQEVISLRSEVQQLKSILIAHKDCPLIVHQTVGTHASKGDGMLNVRC
jgi:hypothetical protein